MTQRTQLDFWDVTHEVLHRMRSANGGILCTVGVSGGADNVLTLGWGLIGPSYHTHPIFSIAVTNGRSSRQVCTSYEAEGRASRKTSATLSASS